VVKEREVEFGYFRWAALTSCQLLLLEWRFHLQLKFGCKGRNGAKGKAETQDTEGNTPRKAEAFGLNRLKPDRERRSSSSASFSWKLKNWCAKSINNKESIKTPLHTCVQEQLFCLDGTPIHAIATERSR